VAEQDWVRLTQSQFTPVEITKVLDRAQLARAAGRRRASVIRLDPGLAFGTGTHPTTRMCLRWMARAATVPPWCARAGLRLRLGHPGHRRRAARGAHIDAVDIDPAGAGHAANAQANGVVLQAGLPTLAQGVYSAGAGQHPGHAAEAAGAAAGRARAPGGTLVLAGILERQADELRDAYAPWLALQVADAEDGWILMTATAAGAGRGMPRR
jgi:ribosomal protein L11 methyltransferase